MRAGPLKYIGGKSRLAATLIPLFPPHITYVEPFAGGAHVLFRKPRSPVEVLNDLDGELVCFLRVCRWHHDELLRCLDFHVRSRRMFDEYRMQPPELLTDVMRAARFLYLQRTAWCGGVNGAKYGYEVTARGPYSNTTIRALVGEAAKRLELVQLENWPYERVLDRYDREQTFFFLDPPYVGMPFYKFNFSEDDYSKLAARLGSLKGKFLLTINDHPIARAAFAHFHTLSVPVRYSVRKTRAHELIFANYPLSCCFKPANGA